MAKYIRTDTVNAAQWDPADTEPTRELLLSIMGKLKKCSLIKKIPASKLKEENAISIDGISIVVEIGNNTYPANPGEYLVIENGKLKVINAKNFEAQYQLKNGGNTEEGEGGEEQDPDAPVVTPGGGGIAEGTV